MPRVPALLMAMALAGCLDPLVSDEVPTTGLILDPATDLSSLPHVEDDGAQAARVPLFTSRIEYLQGYASGRLTWYWNANGPVNDLIAPLYVLVAADGSRSPPIIDALPGEPGYSPWWRVIEVRATAAYAGQKLTSRRAVEAAIDAGLVEAPVATTVIVSAVVVQRDLPAVAVGNGLSVEPTIAFYKGLRVSWVRFSDTVERPVEQQTLEALPVYNLQRIDQAFPLYEAVADLDLNGDGRIDASNNIFARDLDEPDYSPLWVPTLVRVAPDVRSIDTSTGTPELTRESDLLDGTMPRAPRVLSITPQDRLLNCPLQRTKGEL